jgi:hypothetical protein
MRAPESQPIPEATEILAAIRGTEGRSCWEFAQSFGQMAAKSPDRGWDLLRQVFDFVLKPSAVLDPFGPISEAKGKRSMIPADLTAEQLDELRKTLEVVDCPVYQSRIGDVLWLQQRDAKAARIAVDAYLEAGKRIEHPESWPPSMEMYERALRLARQIEPRGALPTLVLAHLESRVVHYSGNDPLYFTCKALELLAEFRHGDSKALVEIAGRVAEASRSSGDFSRARSYYDVQAMHWKLAGEPGHAENARALGAKTFVEEAESREAEGEFTVAHSFWGDAISAYRDRPSLRQEITELKRRYSIAGVKLRDEMKTVSSDKINIAAFVDASRNSFRGLVWDDAFFQLAFITPTIDPTELRRTTLEGTSGSIHPTISASIFDASGRKIGVRPSILTDNKAQYERAIAGLMEQNAEIHRQFSIYAHIAPAIRQIIEDHDVDQRLLGVVLDDSGLIPEDRRVLFYQAFEAGFRWDFSTALHLLIPQVENALRYVLEQSGISPVNVDAEGVEEVWGLERILNHPTILETLGESLAFELRSLLIERLGPNMRNVFAHGALSPDGFRGTTAFYLWWVILRLVAIPTAGMNAFIERNEASGRQDPNSEPPE